MSRKLPSRARWCENPFSHPLRPESFPAGAGWESRSSACEIGISHERTHRRATVLVMVIAVLAMLFVMGSTLLIIARFERQTADTKQTTKTFKAVSNTVLDPILQQLRDDADGANGQAYDRGWVANGGDSSILEDFGDFPGYTMTAPAGNGDLLLSSMEPFYDSLSATPAWRNYAVSWALDALPTGGGNPNTMLVQTLLTGGPFVVIPPVTGTKFGDADGDGLIDSTNAISVGLSGMFGGSYEMFLRVLPHGGMVLIDPFTHPSLLAQVIHPEDAAYYANPSQLWANPPLVLDPGTDEQALRRRFMLPRATPRTDPNTLEQKLPVTTGYKEPSSSPSWLKQMTPHWWAVDDRIVPGDNDWWQTRLTPGSNPPSFGVSGKAITDTGYNAGGDFYDRRHLITTISSDDILRPRREERRLAQFKDPGVDGVPSTDDVNTFYNVLNYDPADPATQIPVTSGGNMQYGRDGTPAGTVRFNGPGLRSAFSLRDVLVDPTLATSQISDSGGAALGYGVQASYMKAVQLTAYYLAMIQHTSVPGTDKSLTGASPPTQADYGEQLRTAAQLAVNTLDYADNGDSDNNGAPDKADPLSLFVWPPPPNPTPSVQVIGVEKQPFLTEAYAMVAADYPAGLYSAASSKTKSLWAVELYNPYGVPLSLDGYQLSVDTVTPRTNLGTLKAGLLPGERVVFASAGLDPNMGAANLPFDNAAGGTNVILLATLQFGDPFNDPSPGVRPTIPPIELLRTGDHVLNLATKQLGNPTATVIVDRIDTTNAVAASPVDLTKWAQRPSNADIADPPPTAAPPGRGAGHSPPMLNTTYWRHTSLQRHKEAFAAASNQNVTPISWHFTLAYQRAFESEVQYTGQAPPPTYVAHDMLGRGRTANDPTRYVADNDPAWIQAAGASPIAGFPILVADSGLDPKSMGCLAFPTTGSLLLVTRYGHGQRWVIDPAASPAALKIDFTPVTVSAVTPLYEDPADPTKAIHPLLAQMQWTDNGHMPIFDSGQMCKDNAAGEGRVKGPWGQLVFDYFTALPLEELIRPLDLSALGLGASTRLIDLASDADYTRAYAAIFSPQVSSTAQGYPLVERVSASSSPFGPKVRGRININLAPWWVLDGLPLMPSGAQTTDAQGRPQPLTGMPVPELIVSPAINRLDPTNYAAGSQAAAILVNELADDPTDPQPPPLGLPSVSPMLAKYMVSKREVIPNPASPATPPYISRTVDGVNAASTAPGFTTVGGMFDLLAAVKLVGTFSVGPPNPTIDELRKADDGGTPLSKPYYYLGFLQAVAPVVRLQDWATVKTNVFTVYSTIGTTSQPEVWLRTQVTVDRTRCFYSNDLPARITDMEPIGYYNAADD